jgi:hypothetical protein
LENAFLVIRRDTGTGVGDPHLDAVAAAPGAHPYPAAVGRVGHRIGDKVDRDLEDLALVSVDDRRALDLDADGDRPPRGLLAAQVYGRREQVAQVEAGKLQFELS